MQKIAILYDASQAVLSTFELDEVLQQISTIARDYFHLQNVAILLLDKDGSLYPRCQFGWDPGNEDIRLPVGTGLTGAAAQKKRPIYAPDVTNDQRYVISAASTRSELAVPLMVRDKVVGVLDCQSDKLDHFDSETIDLLTLFSTQASMALQNATLYSLERRRASQLEAINAIAQQLTAVLDLPQLLERVCSQARQAFQLSHVSVLLKEEEDLVLRASEGSLVAAVREEDRFPAGEAVWGRAFCERKALVENEIDHTKSPGLNTGAGSRMCIPLISFGQTLGVLVLESSEKMAFQPYDIQPL